MKVKNMITLENINKYSLQDVFDQGAKHLLDQNCKSLSEDGEDCKYRGENGTKCGVGCYITDKMYDPRMEDLGIISLDVMFNYGIESKKINLLGKIQYIHDTSPVSKWSCYLLDLSKKLNLTYKF